MDQIIAGTETTARQLDSQTGENLRTHVSRVLQTSADPKCNLPGYLCRTAKELKDDDTIIIVPADKGNTTVVMSKKDYEDKVNAMLLDETYRKLKKDPTAKIEKQMGWH